VFKEAKGEELHMPFQRLTYAEAMERYGSDKPDLRYSLELASVSDVVKDCGFGIFSGAVADGGVVKALRVPEGKRISNGRIKPKVNAPFTPPYLHSQLCVCALCVRVYMCATSRRRRS